MSGFTPGWLAAREPADHAARSLRAPLELAKKFAKMVGERAQGPVRLVDLAGGTGNNVRFLAPLIRGEQHWAVWDSDSSLLARSHEFCWIWAQKRGWDAVPAGDRLVVAGPDFSLSISFVARDLREHLDLSGFDGVSCAALLDFVSASWCEGLIEAVERAGSPPLLCSLIADGGWSWTPVLSEDRAVGELFGRDMGRDKGFGPSLGYGAAAVAAEMLRAHGLSVEQAASPWHIGGGATELQTYLLDFHAAAIENVEGPGVERWRNWLTARRNLLRQQKLCVSHREVLASR